MKSITEIHHDSNKGKSEVQIILENLFQLKKSYGWQNPFKVEPEKYVGAIDGDDFEIAFNSSLFRAFDFYKIGWKVKGQISETPSGTRVSMHFGYNWIGQLWRYGTAALAILVVLLFRDLTGLLLMSIFLFIIFYIMPKGLINESKLIKQILEEQL